MSNQPIQRQPRRSTRDGQPLTSGEALARANRAYYDDLEMTYRCHGVAFTSREVDQVVALVREWGEGHLFVSHALVKHMTPRVRRWARETVGLIGYARLLALGEAQPGDRRLRYQFKFDFDPCYDVPLEAAWRIVRAMLARDTNGALAAGYSITRHPGWASLHLTPAGERGHHEADVAAMERVLDRLAQARYLIFQQAGSVWAITEGQI